MNDAIASRSFALLLTSLRQKWSAGISCPSETHFAIGVSLIWAVLYNLPFWAQSAQAMWHPTPSGIGFLLSLFLLVLSAHTLLLLLMPTRTTMRVATSILFVVAAASAYFCNEYGAIMNKDMLRNVLETDPAEISGLINFDMVASILVLGVMPATLVWRVSLPSISYGRRVKQRLIAYSALVVTCFFALFAYSADYAVFFREHKPIRFTLTPAAPLTSLIGLLSGAGDIRGDEPLLNPAGESLQIGTTHSRPLVLFVVIGETARAANFQLGGYERQTNAELKGIDDLVYFSQTASCGTSTALSVPCMFSALGREHFDVGEASRYTNLLDALQAANVEVEWRDNNAGCKGVCARVTQITYSDLENDTLCAQSYCYDEVMLTDLAARIREVTHDTVFVFHQIGSHGPAYFERYPPEFERFKPACRSNQLHRCTAQEVANAYDNTIAYTDHVLARHIAILRKASDHVDGAMIYASDHGESLGEQGIYLHGMPYSFAPRTQKHVPMLLWTSSEYQARVGLRVDCVRSRATESYSHDNLYHTILGMAEVRNRIYQPALDILAGCRNDNLDYDHE